MLTRRSFLGTALTLTGAGIVARRLDAQDNAKQGVGVKGEVISQPPASQGGVDALPDPSLIGQRRDPLDPLDNDATLIETERKLLCNCGCPHDIYTCRTTDFSCTFAPELHREIRDMFKQGKEPQEIIDFMVAREGPQMLLSHPVEGLNIAGYLLPGLSVASAVLLLTAYLMRKRVSGPTMASAPGLPGTQAIDDTARARLQRALDEVES